MKDKICLITGANSGIGKITARELAKRGAHVIMLCRNEEKAERAKEDILKVCGHDRVDIVLADFASTAQIREAADYINAHYPHLDVLNNNAGLLMGSKREITEDGFEMTFGVNHLAPFLLTYLLMDKVFASKRGNIINVSSEAHRIANLDFNNLQMEKNYGGLRAYAVSKLCNILFTHELAKRLQGTHVVANALHPGGIATGLYEGVSGFFGTVMKLTKPFLPGEEKGAETSIYLATSEEGYTANGKYFKNKKPASPTKVATNDYNARRLWEVSEALLNIRFEPEKKSLSNR
ncbi:SDR family oxidoreductase [Catalinimonas niigatensis]|uniref:SDR family oxidoreductase n=1 Tax=Catalinimonas niigatensis TaxID=1397264 RepID=UPI00266592C4|nr:SDR family oxidoreductase [Catalinimonas niigatensis]WPP49438.1 SDR family oxidoreductase [Catalinimonas niigatensis]